MRFIARAGSLKGSYYIEEKKPFPWVEIYCAITAGFSFFCIGILRSYTSPALVSMEKDHDINHTLSLDDLSWFASAPPLAAFGGAILSAPLLQFIGRQKSIVVLTFPCFIGWLLIGFASNTTMIIVGRALTGISSGLSICTAQLYVSECARPRIRGALGFLPGMMLALGILVGLIIGTTMHWRQAAFAMVVFPAVLLVMSLFLPESPTWLLMKNRESDAYDSLQTIRGKGRDLKVRQELDEVKDIIETNKETFRHLRLQAVISRQEIWWPTCLTISLMIFQQFSGANALIYYLENILYEAQKVSKGGKLSIAPDLSSIIVGIVQFFSFFISLPLIDRVGRRFLLLTSTILMALSHLCIGTYFYLCEQNKADESGMIATTSWLPLTSICAFIASYSIGFASIPFIIASEVFPPHLRSYLCSIASLVNLLGTFLVVRYFPFLKEILYPGYIYYYFTLICILSIVVTLYAMPETKGKSLAQIQQCFRSHNPSSHYDDIDLYTNSRHEMINNSNRIVM